MSDENNGIKFGFDDRARFEAKKKFFITSKKLFNSYIILYVVSATAMIVIAGLVNIGVTLLAVLGTWMLTCVTVNDKRRF